MVFLVWCNLLYGETINLTHGANPVKSGTIPAQSIDGVLYLELTELSQTMKWGIVPDSDGDRLRIDLPVQSLVFTADNPFVLTGGELWQFPQPVLIIDERFYAPASETALLLDKMYPGTVRWDSLATRLTIIPPVADLLGVRITTDDTGTTVTIVTARAVKYKSETRKDGAVVLQFAGAGADRAKITGGKGAGELTRWTADINAKGVTLTLFPDSSSILKHIKQTSAPHSVVVRFDWVPGKVASTSVTRVDNRERLNQDRSAWAMDLVVIDPGHGGKDPGAVGQKGLKESAVVLDIGHKLRAALQKENIRVEMTRTADTFVPLHERTKFANKVGGKLFVSIHCNAAKDRKATGTETYFLSPSKNKRAMELAKYENSVISFEEDQNRYSGMSDENFILLTMAQSQFVQESQQLAGAIQDKVPAGLKLRNRGVDQAGFYVLVGASMPAVLFETAFISNPQEEAQLNDPKFRQKVADGLADAIIKFIRSQK